MPLDYTVDHVRRRVRVKGSDPLDPGAVIGLFDRQVAEGAWRYAVLEDLRGVQWAPSADELRRLIDHVQTISRTHGARGPIAFLVSDNTALYGMFRMYSILGESFGAAIEVFRDEQEAHHWLDSRG